MQKSSEFSRQTNEEETEWQELILLSTHHPTACDLLRAMLQNSCLLHLLILSKRGKTLSCEKL